MGKRKKRSNSNNQGTNNESGVVNPATLNTGADEEDDSLDEMDRLLSDEGPDIRYTQMGK